MTPNSFAYIVFLVIGALIYHPLSQKAKKPFLLLLNFMFYAIGGVKFLPLLALTVAFNFFAAQKLERTERKRGLLTLVLVLNLGALGLFKYLGFSESCSAAPVCSSVCRSWPCRSAFRSIRSSSAAI